MAEALAARALASALDQTCLPLASAATLPAAVFTSAAIYALECRELFARSWLAVAREADLPLQGSYVTAEIGSERVLVVRAEDGELRAFFNVCRHRGARLVTEPRGTLRGAIACPYHAWTYALDGRLQRAPRMDATLSGGTIALASLALARAEGFVWVSLQAAATPPEALPGFLPELGAFGLERLRRAGRLDYEVECNWKVVCENYSECYHCPGVHPQLSRLSELSSGGFEVGANFNGGPMQLRSGVETLSMSGRSDWPRLTNDPGSAGLVHYYLVYPNLMLGIHPDYLLTHRVWPLAASRSRIECELLVAPETLAARDFDASGVLQFWDLTNRQDWALCERVQQGAGSQGYRPGPYHPSERCVHAFDRWYAQWLRAHGPSDTANDA